MNRLISFCAGFGMLFLFGFLGIMILSFTYPNSWIGGLFGNNHYNLTIGLVFLKGNSAAKNAQIDANLAVFNDRILDITLNAINDINAIVLKERSENYYIPPQVKEDISYS